ncbi:unnamed protein product [Closterium sp. NIES-65]|nr:unnamed protein product [Closterium sp. NIES-65]
MSECAALSPAAASASTSPAASRFPGERASPGSGASPGGDAAAVEPQRASAGGAASADCAASPGGDAAPGGERHLFCFGLGYVAVALSSVLLSKGWRVSGTCRSQEDWHRLCHMGLQAHLLEDHGTDSTVCLPQAALSALHSATHVLVSIPPLLSPRPSSPQHVDVVLSSCCQHLMQSARHGLRWIGYLSSTGVYAYDSSPLISPISPSLCHPRLSPASLRHPRLSPSYNSALDTAAVEMAFESTQKSPLDTAAAAEMGAGEAQSSVSAAMLDSTRSRRGESSCEKGNLSSEAPSGNWGSNSDRGSSNHKGDSGSKRDESSTNRERRQRKRFTSRCHVADICAAIGASMDGRGSSAIINIVDDDPSPRHHVMQFARQLIASGESDLYWQKLKALRITLPPGIIRRGDSGRVRGAEKEKKKTTHPTIVTGT